MTSSSEGHGAQEQHRRRENGAYKLVFVCGGKMQSTYLPRSLFGRTRISFMYKIIQQQIEKWRRESP